MLLGEYSLSPEGDFENSSSRKRYMDQRSVYLCPVSLNAPGDTPQEEIKSVCTSSIYLDNMFFFLRYSNEKLLLLLDHEFICNRNVLELVMCAPYDNTNNWTLAVSKYRNTIYMCQIQNDACGAPRFDHEQLKKTLWMKKLRQHCLESMGN